MYKSITLFLTVVIVTIISFFLHEVSHWLSYELLGYEAGFTLNTANVKDQTAVLSMTEKLMSDAAGPVFTILQAIVFFYILKTKKSLYWYSVLFVAFVQRLMAGIFNIFQANDEGRISQALELPLFTVSIVVVGFLFTLVYKTSKRNNYSLKDNLLLLAYSILAVVLVVLIDNKFNIQFV